MLMAPQLEGATLDPSHHGLYKANPDAFASGSINRLAAGVELNKPSQALLRSISPAEAYQFVAQANERWQAEQSKDGKGDASGGGKSASSAASAAKDRLKIGSSADGNEQERRYTENLVAQEKELEQAKARVAELEKNIADLQRLLEKSKEKKAVDNNFGFGGFGPVILAIGLIALTGLLLWGLARHARRSEGPAFDGAIQLQNGEQTAAPSSGAAFEMPERAKALFAGIDLDLTKPAKQAPVGAHPVAPAPVDTSGASNPLADTLRVKLNLARAYITIEAQGLLSEFSHRQA